MSAKVSVSSPLLMPALVVLPTVLGSFLLPSVPKLYLAAWSLVALTVQVLYRAYKHRAWFKGLPGPPHSMFLGHLPIMAKIAATLPPNCHPQLLQTIIMREYNLPDLFYLDLWPVGPSFLVLGKRELMDQVQVLKPEPMHALTGSVLDPIMGPGVIAAANGPLWKRLHNSIAPAFAWSHIRSLVPMIADECETFRETLSRLAESGETFSMERRATELIFDAISRTLFNYSLEAQKGGNKVLRDIQAMVALTEASISINPFVWIPAWLKRGHIRRRVASFVEHQARLRYQLLKENKIVPSRKDPDSILDLLLREHMQKIEEQGLTGKQADIGKEDMALLVTNLKGLLVGGAGTTTDTLCFASMLLSKNPKCLAKLRAEHDRIFAPSHGQTVAILTESPHKLAELEYTQAVISETLRLFPVGGSLREGRPGATLTHNGVVYPIDNGVAIQAAAHALHYDPLVYPSPSTFDPSRFINPQTAASAKQNMRTFSRGSRACLGQNLAQDELKVILLMTVREFEFECVGEFFRPNKVPRTVYTDLDTIYGDTAFQELGIEAKPRGGVMMKVRKVQR